MLHIAASMVAAYEKLKEGAIMEAFTKWKAYYALATADADFKQEWGPEEQLRQRWERATMIKVCSSIPPATNPPPESVAVHRHGHA